MKVERLSSSHTHHCQGNEKTKDLSKLEANLSYFGPSSSSLHSSAEECQALTLGASLDVDGMT